MGSFQQENLTKLAFILMGIASLIGWNAISSSFQYFATKYGNRVFTNFTFPLECGNCFWGIMMPFLASKLTAFQRITGCLILQSIILIFLPIFAELEPNNTGYTVSMIFTFFIGSFQSIGQNSMIALTVREGGSIIPLFWLATGISGIFVNILAMILTAIFPKDSKNLFYQTIIFFICAASISYLAVYFTWKYIKQSNLRTPQSLEHQPSYHQVLAGEQQEIIDGSCIQFQNNIKDAYQKQGFLDKVRDAFIHVRLIPVFIYLTYAVSFLLYPGITISDIQFTNKFLNSNNQVWGALLLNFAYNIGDALGKYYGNIGIFLSRTFAYTLSILRLIFIPLAFVTAYQIGADVFSTNWYPFLQLFLIGLTNGILTTSLFALASRKGENNEKVQENIGFLCGFSLTFGLASGSFLAYVLDPHTVISYFYDPITV